MSLHLKYKLFRIANFGVLENSNFKEKKILQIYNLFLLLVGFNVSFLGILLFIYSFYGQLLFMAGSLLCIIFVLYLNKKGYTLISKVFIVQFFILCVLSILCIFSFYTIFPLFFFLIILYYSLIFFEKEKSLMIFFVFQCVFCLFLSFTSLHKYLPNLNLLEASEISNMNLICIIAFIIFLFTFIYFHTDYQRKLEMKYINMNNRLQIRNEINEKNNLNNKRLLTIISILLQKNLEEYKLLFNSYLEIKNNKEENNKKLDTQFLKLSKKNKKIEELINFRFTNNREALYENEFEKCSIKQKSIKIISETLNNVIIDKKNDFEINIHLDLYKIFLIEIIKEIKRNYYPNLIQLNFFLNKEIESQDEKTAYELFGIKVTHAIKEDTGALVVDLHFFNNTDKTAIYYV